MILDNSSSTPDFSSISTQITGAITLVNIDQPHSQLSLSAWSSLVWVEVSMQNMARMLRLLDTSMVKTRMMIKPGVWDKKVMLWSSIIIIASTAQDYILHCWHWVWEDYSQSPSCSSPSSWLHGHTGNTPRSMTLIIVFHCQHTKSVRIIPSLSSQRQPFSMATRSLTEELLASLLENPTKIKGEVFR